MAMHRRGRRTALVAVGAAVVAACAPAAPPSGVVGTAHPTTNTPAPHTPTTVTASAARPTTPPGWRLVFADEFSGAALDTTVWKPYFNTYGDGNNEIACLTPSNVTVAGGALRITARRERITCPGAAPDQYSSGFVGTRERGRYFPRYGRYEARVRIPHGQGLWPAFWLRHRDGSSFGEVDIMEYFHNQVPGLATTTIHWNHRRNLGKRSSAFERPTTSPGWHTFAIEILPDSGGVRFNWYIDDVLRNSHRESDTAPVTRHGDAPVWDIALNLAVGGDYGGHPEDPIGTLRTRTDPTRASVCSIWKYRSNFPNCPTRSDDGTPILRAAFPATYEVDYVRVYTPA